METQNVSAQVYFKQLPTDPNAGRYGCNNTDNLLSTCVNDVETDANIENAFQSQFGLSEYYKTPGVFNAIKTDFIDKTMGNEGPVKLPKHQEYYPVDKKDEMSQEQQDLLSKMAFAQKVNETNPNLNEIKSNFGNKISGNKSTFGDKSNFGSNNLFLILLIILIAFGYFYLKK
jgi:hypothetical protein